MNRTKKALLQGFAGLLALWLLNGYFGFMRNLGPGAMLPYIELALLGAYWYAVYKSWRSSRPNDPIRKRKVSIKVSRKTEPDLDADEIQRLVDLQEAVAAEKLRRQRARFNDTAKRFTSHLFDPKGEFRKKVLPPLAAISLLVIVVAAGLLGQSLYSKYQADAKASASASHSAEVSEAVRVTMVYRNACLRKKFDERWRNWLFEHPITIEKGWVSKVNKFGSITTSYDHTIVNTITELDDWKDLPNVVRTASARVIGYEYSYFDPLVAALRSLCEDTVPVQSPATDQDVRAATGVVKFFGRDADDWDDNLVCWTDQRKKLATICPP